MFTFKKFNLLAPFFWKHVDIKTKSLCWDWKGTCVRNGYGTAWIGGKSFRSNRLAFFLAYRYWPENACHTCDNPKCCNPFHLYDGDAQQNQQDCIDRKRKRAPKGEKHYLSKLTVKQVKEIRRIYVPYKMSIGKLAKRFKVKPSTIQQILEYRSWKNI